MFAPVVPSKIPSKLQTITHNMMAWWCLHIQHDAYEDARLVVGCDLALTLWGGGGG